MESNRRGTDRRRKPSNNRRFYVEGSSVRQTAPSPYRKQSKGTANAGNAALPQRRKPGTSRQTVQTRTVDKRRQVNQRIAMRNREKALKLDLKYTLFLGISVIFVLISCVLYLNLQNQMTQKSSKIASLTSELATLTDANSAARERISSAVDLEYVYKYATEKLGMAPPIQSQIIKYQSSDEDYVKQFQDIPQSDK